MLSSTKVFGLLMVTLVIGFSASSTYGKETGKKKRSLANVESSAYPALALQGDIAKGRALYQSCVGCHLPSGAGKTDGTYPQIAGQHSTVLIKQLTDIREKRRINPSMDEVMRAFADDQELANVVAYLQTLKIPRNNGKGVDNFDERARGQQLYQSNCVQCHGSFGEGNAAKYYPVIAGQHYEYVYRQIKAVKENARGNSHAGMTERLLTYTDEDIKALSNYVSLLVWPLRSGN